MTSQSPFFVKDCTIATLATGIRAQTLPELRDRLVNISESSLFFHFWGMRLKTSFEHPDYHNDFSFWAHNDLHDDTLAERMEILDPTEHPNFEVMRNDLINLIEDRLDEREALITVRAEQSFYFGDGKIIIFNTRHVCERPEDLVKIMPSIPKGSIFYHFIDARRRSELHNDDLSVWLKASGHPDLAVMLAKIDPYFISLKDLQRKLCEVVYNYFIPHENGGGGHE
jgi:hypothetical protein